MALSRRIIRKTFAGILRAKLVGDGKPAESVEDHRIGDFKGRSPVVVVSTSGVKRVRGTFQGSFAQVYLQIDVFTLYVDTDAGFSEADAEDTADAIEQLIAEAIDINQSNKLWDGVSYVDRSEVGDILDLGGTEYKREMIPIVITAHG